MVPSADFQDIVDNFELFDDWEDRYRYVIELGRAMPPLPDELKSAATKVDGCASQVWLVPEIRPGGESGRNGERNEDTLYFEGDSDAMIVRGLIAILRALYCGQPLCAVPQIDAQRELGRLDLEQHLSSQRSNGLKAMVRRINDLARAGAPA